MGLHQDARDHVADRVFVAELVFAAKYLLKGDQLVLLRPRQRPAKSTLGE
jgi:hypothetical protein